LLCIRQDNRAKMVLQDRRAPYRAVGVYKAVKVCKAMVLRPTYGWDKTAWWAVVLQGKQAPQDRARNFGWCYRANRRFRTRRHGWCYRRAGASGQDGMDGAKEKTAVSSLRTDSAVEEQ
jgi:hypothetical protein